MTAIVREGLEAWLAGIKKARAHGNEPMLDAQLIALAYFIEANSDTFLAALDATPGEGWQDIETAPKDGTKFDVWVPDAFGGHRMTGLSFGWRGKLRQHGTLTEAELPRWPTHWRPVPAAPLSEKEVGTFACPVCGQETPHHHEPSPQPKQCPECGMGTPGHTAECSRCPVAILGPRQ